MPFERPRVRAEGPGGAEVKQGARIACLDCRSAKIRCSAPTDGKVPCKRCARHGRDCVFEKHRRGRKPGRTNNMKPLEGSEMDSADFSAEFSSHLDHHRGGYYGGGGGGSAGPSSHRHPVSGSYGGGAAGGGGVPMHAAFVPHSSQNASAAPPFHPHHSPGSNGWRQSLPSDDPRLASPRAGGAQRNGLASDPQREMHRIPSSSLKSSYMRPAGSPQARDGRSAGYFSGGGGHEGGYAAKQSPAPPSSYSGVQDERHLDLHLGHGSTVKSGEQSSALNTPGMLHPTFGLPRFGGNGGETTYSPPSSGLQSSSLGSGTTPGRSWLDFPTPGGGGGGRSILSPSHLVSTSISTFPSSVGSMSSAWPGSAVTSPHKRKGPTDYFAGALPLSGEGANADGRRKRRPMHRESSEREERSVEGSPGSSHRSRYVDEGEEEEEEEEQVDHMDEDEVGGMQDGDVLSTPLRLLAHASDAALALRQAKGDTEGSASHRSTSVGAATMGLVSPAAPSLPAPRRWFDSGRLPSMLLDRGSSGVRASSAVLGGSGLLPKLASVAQRRDGGQRGLPYVYGRGGGSHGGGASDLPMSLSSKVIRAPSTSSLPPPVLGTLGRSRSYTAVNVHSPRSSFIRSPEQQLHPLTDVPSIVAPVTQVERRAEVLGIHTDAQGRQIEVASDSTGDLSVTATTLDPDAWEYRNGRVRSRKSISGATGTGTGTETGTGTAPTSSFEDGSGGGKGGAAPADETSGVVGPASNLPATATSPVQADLRDPVNGTAEKTGSAEQAASMLVAATKQRAFRKRLDSLESGSQRRWEVIRRRPRTQVDGLTTADLDEEAVSDAGSSEESEKLGASHQDFFSMSIFHSKMDIDIDLDPIEAGLIELHELEKLFDVFFARINPLLTMFDPFLHSVTYVRHRSALLTTVIAALAARLSDSKRSAELAGTLENHWRQRLLPEALLGGYKSVELAQAFMVLALYHKPTNRLSEDRSWQYLGFAVRIATEIGVNRGTQPDDEVKNNEQVRRRMRNRSRLWICLWLTDRGMGLQTGRAFTLSEDDMIANSDLWHREAFALPEDARLVSLVKLTRTVTSYCQAFGQIIKEHSAVPQDQLILSTTAAIDAAQESIKMLNLCRLQATTELERWKDIWCVEALDESKDGIQSLAISTFLDKWKPRAKIDMLYARLHLNSIVLEGLERHERLVMAAAEARRGVAASNSTEEGKEKASTEDSAAPFSSRLEETRTMIDKVALDCWDTTLKMIDIVLVEVPDDDLAAGPNALSVNVIYGALAALRLSNPNVARDADRTWADRSAILKRCKALADALIKAGRTPEHRNGAAAPFGIYLKGIVNIWETERVGVAQDTGVKKVKGEEETNGVQGESCVAEESPKRPALASLPRQPSERGAAHASPPRSGPPHSVGDDVWGSASSSARVRKGTAGVAAAGKANGQPNAANAVVAEDPISMDRMWDYLTTYPDSANTFPMSLWQPQLGNSVNASAFVPVTAAAAASAAAATASDPANGLVDAHNLVEAAVALNMVPAAPHSSMA